MSASKQAHLKPPIFRVCTAPWSESFRITWTPKVCKKLAFMAIIRGLGLLFDIVLGFRI